MSERTEKFFMGKGRFVDDITFPDMLYLEIVRSTQAHARILSVKGGLTANDLPLNLTSTGESYRRGRDYEVEPVLAKEKALYYGQPVSAVYDRDRYKAKDLVETVEISYDELKPVLSIEESLNSAPIHESRKDNVVSKFEIGKRFSLDSVVKLSDQLYIERVLPNPLETRGIVAYYNSGKLNVWISTQSVYSIKNGLTRILGLDPSDINVYQADTGGAFGSKSAVYPEYVIACYLSMKTKQPVKWIESRDEHITSTRPGRGAKAELQIYGDREGRIKGIEGKIYVDVGAYADDLSSTSPSWIGYQITGPYSIENVFIEGYSVYTNKAPLGPYRGAGRPEAAFFIERMMDMYADHIGMDPVELRLKNLPEKAFESPTGLKLLPSKAFFEDGIKKIGYSKLKKKNAGISFGILLPAVSGGESAKIKVENGIIKVWLGGNAHWQRHELFVKRILKEILGIPEDKVFLMNGDTTELQKGIGTWGSRSAITAGNALYKAALLLKEKAQKMNINDQENLLKSDLSSEYYENMQLDPTMISFLLTAAVAEIQDGIKPVIKEVWAYYDVGEPLSEEAVYGQITGGLLMGVQEVLSEALKYDSKGKPIPETLAAAGIAYSINAPKYHVQIATFGRSNTPHGAKGVGEAGTVGAPPAAARAIENLLGKRVNRLPLDFDLLA
ncbi:MAG: xanthine dehydrogenase family protein molybdopterin-binding subunit [Nitrososphaeria archaeon]|nr:xanthine dehydrogenase family protein molybdopterin-binding subunit [Conexivisphaerales archaeon]